MSNLVQNDIRCKIPVNMPEELPILPLHNVVAYPYAIIPLMITNERYIHMVEDALKSDRLVGLLLVKEPSIDNPVPGQIYEIGTVGLIQHGMRRVCENFQVVIEGVERFRVKHWIGTDPYLRACIELKPDVVVPDVELDALQSSLCQLAKEIVALSPNIPGVVSEFIDHVEDPRYLLSIVAINARLKVEVAQQILELDNLKDKFRALISSLTRIKEVLILGKKIQTEASEEINKSQREYYLRQQLKAIQKELGETEEADGDVKSYADKIEEANLPEEAKKEAQRELKRLSGMTPHSAEYPLIRSYLDWLLELPWNVLSDDRLDIHHARAVLDEDHYNLNEVKDRIIEFLAVRKLITERDGKSKKALEPGSGVGMGAILCFAGPPGVGKTSLGKSIARALGREFTHMSLGGMRDEAEIRGHRRTYVGAMPGRIIQAIKRAGTRNPVFMLDEVDKIGSDCRGDPSSALLEVLDPAQNHSFRDHYLDVDFDLSDVMFITTANQLETVPPPLRDRMEIIQLDGYTEYEKLRIATGYLIPRQQKVNGLVENEIYFSTEAIRFIIQGYTREAGVRNLEREIGSICRKTAVKIASAEITHVQVTPETVRENLKKEKFESEISETTLIPGIATGLAVTATGGDILFVEATRMKGKGELTITGQLGDVMRESAQIAYSYTRSKAADLGVPFDLFDKTDVHVHVPAGAIPKDGPSAGVAMVMAMASLFSGRSVQANMGMTGELTLRGRVLPVGGIKMKVLAAHRAGLRTVLLPKKNMPDLDELPEEVHNDMAFIPIEQIDEALKVALTPKKTEA